MAAEAFTSEEQDTYCAWIVTTISAEAAGTEINDIYIGLWLETHVELIVDKYLEIKGLPPL